MRTVRSGAKARISRRRTETCTSDPELRELFRIVFRERIFLEQSLFEVLRVPHRDMVLLAEDGHITLHRRGLSQDLRNQDPALRIDLRHLSEEVHALEK